LGRRASDPPNKEKCAALKRLILKIAFGAGNRTRTGDIDLGKVALYQLSYARVLA
jgi:hypothetical protein